MSPQSSEPKPPSELKRIRTYQSDVEELLQKQNVSKASIALAESERQVEKQKKEEVKKTETSPREPDPSRVFKISGELPTGTGVNLRRSVMVFVGLFVLGGVAAGAFFSFKKDELPVGPAPIARVSETPTIVLSGGEKRAGAIKAIQQGLSALSVPQNELRRALLRRGEALITTPELFELLETGASPALIRALTKWPTLGVHGFQGGQPFLLFGVTSYDHAFAGMLAWEQRLVADIAPLFGVSIREVLANVGSTTAEALQNTIEIKDVIIRNKDGRAVFGPGGDILFVYSFVDKETLVLTTGEDTMRALISKAGGGQLK